MDLFPLNVPRQALSDLVDTIGATVGQSIGSRHEYAKPVFFLIGDACDSERDAFRIPLEAANNAHDCPKANTSTGVVPFRKEQNT
jgi:hypothetical protein